MDLATTALQWQLWRVQRQNSQLLQLVMIAQTNRSLTGERIGCVLTIYGGVGGIQQRWKVAAAMIVDKDFVSVFQ